MVMDVEEPDIKPNKEIREIAEALIADGGDWHQGK